MPHSFWRKIPEKRRAKIMNALKGRGLYWLTRLQRSQIGVIAHELDIPTKRLYEHLQELRKEGVKAENLAERMVQDLTEIRELMNETNLHPGKIKQALGYRTISSVMDEMREHADQMKAMQGQ